MKLEIHQTLDLRYTRLEIYKTRNKRDLIILNNVSLNGKKEFRVLIKHPFLIGKNIIEAKQWLDERYGNSAPGK